MSSELVRVSNLHKSYKNGDEELHILQGVDFTLGRGESLVIQGSSGSGKSTLLSILGGLDSLSSGQVEVNNYCVHELKENRMTHYRSKVVGFVFQLHYLLKDFTALENIMLPAMIGGVSKEQAEHKAMQLIEEIGLIDRREHYPSQLSGGERQRIALARALVNDPVLLLADEPTGNLDEANSRSVEDIMMGLVEKHNKSLIMVTHDSQIAQGCSRRVQLRNGHLEDM